LILEDTQVLYIYHQPRKEISEDQEKDSIFSTVESSAAATTSSSSLQTHTALESVQLFNENCDRAHSENEKFFEGLRETDSVSKKPNSIDKISNEPTITTFKKSFTIEESFINPSVDMVKRKKQSESFVIDFGTRPKTASSPKKKNSTPNLQDSFQRFQKLKIGQLKQQKKLKKAQRKQRQKDRAKPQNMWNLRMRFLYELKKYLGVPYAKRYFKPGEPEYESKIFLDCCGLVRRVLWNLQFLFGFRIGPWNQAYMFDTLPIDIENERDMKPGDLVFISGVYNEGVKFKNSPHNMKHIEVWLGKGQKTIGSRWQRGTVSIFDSYKFESKTYSNMTYHFKSIDTWLKGFCRSVCPEHPWKLSKRPVALSDKSVFAKNKSEKKNSTDKVSQKKISNSNKSSDKNGKKKGSVKKQTKSMSKPTKASEKNKRAENEQQNLQDGYFEGEQCQMSEQLADEFGDLELEQQSAEAAQEQEDYLSDPDNDEIQNSEDIEQMEGAEDCVNDGLGDHFDGDDQSCSDSDLSDDSDEDDNQTPDKIDLEYENQEFMCNPFDDE